jgi:hypothetical protein
MQAFTGDGDASKVITRGVGTETTARDLSLVKY